MKVHFSAKLFFRVFVVTSMLLVLYMFGKPALEAGLPKGSGQGNAETIVQEEEAAQEGQLTLNAQCAVLMDGDSGRILYAKNSQEIRPMASTTKIMTCILALERGNLEDTVTVSSYAASMPDVQLNIRQGEEYALADLLYSLMLESHNDSAVAIAEHLAGSVEEFSVMMNEKAKEIGCVNTTFLTPNGLDGEVTGEDGEKRIHSTTAAELAKIFRYCIEESPQKEKFIEVTGTHDYSFSDKSGKRSFSLVNHNALLETMEGAFSGKTGFTGEAGFCYVGAVKKGEKTFIVALLACGWPPHKTYKWTDTQRLIAYGDKYFHLEDLGEVAVDWGRFSHVQVKNAGNCKKGDFLFLPLRHLEGSGQGKVLLKEGEEAEIHYEGAASLTAPVEEGTAVGKVSILIGGKEYFHYELVAASSCMAK